MLIYKAFIFSSIISFIVGFFTQSSTSLNAYITGYSVLSLGILMILIMSFANILNITQNENIYNTLKIIFMISGPFLLIFSVIAFVLYLIINYKDKIINNHVAPGYNTFSNIILMLLLIQIYIIYNNINNERFEATGKISKVTSGIIYLIGTLSGISSIILYIILKYYSTDGFTSMNILNKFIR
jgi:hypothetical protein